MRFRELNGKVLDIVEGDMYDVEVDHVMSVGYPRMRLGHCVLGSCCVYVYLRVFVEWAWMRESAVTKCIEMRGHAVNMEGVSRRR